MINKSVSHLVLAKKLRDRIKFVQNFYSQNVLLSIVDKQLTAEDLELDSFTFLSHLFPLPCGAGSTVPREGFDSSVIMPFSWCVVAVTLPI